MIKKKYISLFKIAMQETLAYRVSFFINMLSKFISMLTVFYIWKGIFHSRDVLNGYSWDQMKTYLFVTFIVNSLISWYTEGKISAKIMDGSVAMDLLKPIDFQKTQLARTLGASFTEIGISLIFSSIFIILFGGIILPTDFTHVILFLISAFVSFFVKFGIVYFFGLLCFFTTSSLGIRWARGAITDLFSGALIPISFFPNWILGLSKVLPFQGIIFIPVSIFTGTAGSYANMLWLIAQQTAWAIIIWYMGKLLWKFALKNVVIQGG